MYGSKSSKKRKEIEGKRKKKGKGKKENGFRRKRGIEEGES
jgi:hypothetical protein